MTLQEVRTMVASRLRDAGIEAYDYETWVLLDWKLGIQRMDFYMDSGKEIDSSQIELLEDALKKREARVPLQYLMHQCEFMGYDFYVDERVLIPRQDTECLVEEAIQYIERIRENRKKIRVLDMCTGSGCIGISIKLLCPDVDVTLSDLSEDALSVARKNKDTLDAEVRILQGDLFDSMKNIGEDEVRFDLIVSNPPYIPSEVVEGLMPEVRDHEPHMALDGTQDGLAFYRKITKEAPRYLNPGGGLFYEIGAEQGQDVSNLMRESGFEELSIVRDLAGLDRIVKGRLLSKKQEKSIH